MLVAVGGKKVKGTPREEVLKSFQGEDGTSVTVTMRKVAFPPRLQFMYVCFKVEKADVARKQDPPSQPRHGM